MKQGKPLEAGKFYHIYTRGNNRENIFLEHRNYGYFLQLYRKYITPYADTYAYCLLRNHFHFLIRVKEPYEIPTSHVSETEVLPPVNLSRQFSNLLNAYTKSINKTYGRTGSLFQERFRRLEVKQKTYFTKLVHYIHFNPQKHGFISDYREYPYSSYHSYLSHKPTNLQREQVLGWFGGEKPFLNFHQNTEPVFWSIREIIEYD